MTEVTGLPDLATAPAAAHGSVVIVAVVPGATPLLDAAYKTLLPAAPAAGAFLATASNLADVPDPGRARANISRGVVALASAPVVATDAALGNAFTLLLTQDAALAAPANLAAGAPYAWQVTQDAVGSRTLAFDPAFRWANGLPPALSTTPGAVDVLSAMSFDGATLDCVLTKAIS